VQLECCFVKGFDLIGKDVGRLEGIEAHVPRTWCAVFFLPLSAVASLGY
jgi:hypothetical protein